MLSALSVLFNAHNKPFEVVFITSIYRVSKWSWGKSTTYSKFQSQVQVKPGLVHPCHLIPISPTRAGENGMIPLGLHYTDCSFKTSDITEGCYLQQHLVNRWILCATLHVSHSGKRNPKFFLWNVMQEVGIFFFLIPAIP